MKTRSGVGGELAGLCRSALVFALLGIVLTACESSSDDDDESAVGDPSGTQGPPPSDLPPLGAPVSIDGGPPVGEWHWEQGSTSDGGQGQAVAGLECEDSSPLGYHVHAHLSIILNGEQLRVPPVVGFVSDASSDCQYPLHTHDASGLIHVHADAPADFTLGQFFEIWGQPLEPMNVAGLVNLPAVIYIVDDGEVSEYEGDFADVELISKRLITIQVGTEISEIPTYTWSFP